MANQAEAANLTKVTTGICRLSYLKVAKAEKSKEFPNQDPRYSVCVLIDKNDSETLKRIKGAISVAADNFFAGKVPSKMKNALRDGDEDHPDDAAYKGMMFVNAWTGEDSPPLLKEGNDRQEVTNPREWVSGDYGNVILNFKGYDNSGSKGVGAYLGGIWFRKKGKPLVSSVSESDFDKAFGDVDDDFLG